MGKNRSNVYCETCKKFHRQGVHSEKIIDPLVKGDEKALMRFVRRASRDLYLSRDMLGDADEFKYSDIVKEDDKVLLSPNIFEDGDKNESGRNSKKDK